MSGQFVVRAEKPWNPYLLGARLLTNQAFLRLEPTLTAVSAERIKHELQQRIGDESPWQGMIFIELRPTTSANQPITVTGGRFRDGWQYRVEIPDVVDKDRYVRAITQVFFLEMANRKSESRSVELPLWLVEGSSEQLLAVDGPEIILPPPDQFVNGVNYKRINPIMDINRASSLKEAHTVLSTNAALTFDQLSWPTQDEISGANAACYRSSAQLLVNRLLEFPDGAACLHQMIVDMPNHLNWQLAFLSGFSPHFQSVGDTEKWWALQSAHFVGRNLDQTWPVKESLEKLGEVLLTPVAPAAETNETSSTATASLQAVIQEWEGVRQIPLLKNKVRELESLRLRLARQVLVLEQQYRQLIASYLLSHSGLATGAESTKKPRVDRKAKATIEALNTLDQQRIEELHRADQALASAQTSPGR